MSFMLTFFVLRGFDSKHGANYPNTTENRGVGIIRERENLS